MESYRYLYVRCSLYSSLSISFLFVLLCFSSVFFSFTSVGSGPCTYTYIHLGNDDIWNPPRSRAFAMEEKCTATSLLSDFCINPALFGLMHIAFDFALFLLCAFWNFRIALLASAKFSSPVSFYLCSGKYRYVRERISLTTLVFSLQTEKHWRKELFSNFVHTIQCNRLLTPQNLFIPLYLYRSWFFCSLRRYSWKKMSLMHETDHLLIREISK